MHNSSPLSQYFVILILASFLVVSGSNFCSAKCVYTFTGYSYTAGCSGTTSSDCTSCDTASGLFQGPAPCSYNTTGYTFVEMVYDPPALDGTFTLSNAPVAAVDAQASYTVLLFTGNTSMYRSVTTTEAHQAIRIRFFILIVNNPTFTIKIYIDNDLTNPVVADNSTRAFLASSGNDSYIYTSPDIAHSGSSAKVTLSIEGVSGSFGIKQFMVFTKKCPTQCATCTYLNKCTSCNNISTTVYKLAGTSCVLSCPEGYIADANDPNRCLACTSPCYTCTSIVTYCLTCLNTTTTKYFYNYTCVSSCPAKTYLDATTNTCNSCYYTCGTCNGSSNSSCVSCNTDVADKTYIMWAAGGVCDQNCPPGQYAVVGTTCQYCDPKCLTCVNSSSNCYSCRAQGTYASYLLEHNNTCVYFCPTNFVPAYNRSCVCNTSGYFMEATTNTCTICASACSTCNGNTWDNCLSCSDGYYLLINTTMCRSLCPSGSYAVTLTNKCAACDATCYTCAAIASMCTGCTGSRYLLEGACLTTCPDGYQKNLNPNVCSKCRSTEFSYQGKCMSVCPAGYQAFNGVCLAAEMVLTKKHTVKITPTIVNKGTRLCISVLFSAALSDKASLKYQDFNVSITLLKSPIARMLNTLVQSLEVVNLELSDNRKSLNIFTKLPSAWNIQTNGLSLDFNQKSLISSDSVSFDSFSIVYPLSQPSFVNQLYTKYFKSSLDIVGILSTSFGLLLIALCYWNKYAFYSCLEFYMTVQMYRLLVFLRPSAPSFELFTFLRGFDNAQFLFLPSIFELGFPAGYKEKCFAPFALKTTDMNFLRLTGSNFLFLIIAATPIVYMHFYDKQAYKKAIKWFKKVVSYLASINLVFGVCSSFYSLFLNTDLQSPVFIFSQICSLCIILPLYTFFKRQRRGITAYKIFLIGFGVNCLIFPLFSLRAPFILIVYDIVQGGLLIYFFHKVKPSIGLRWLPGFAERLGFLVSANVMIMTTNYTVVVAVVTISVAVNFLLKCFILYKGFQSQATEEQEIEAQPSQEMKAISNDDNDKRTSQLMEEEKANNLSHSNNNSKVFINQTIQSQVNIDEKDNRIQFPAVIYEHDIEDSPVRKPVDHRVHNIETGQAAHRDELLDNQLKPFNLSHTPKPRQIGIKFPEAPPSKTVFLQPEAEHKKRRNRVNLRDQEEQMSQF